MRIRETWVNETKGNIIGDSDWYEPFTEDRKRLFQAMQREYGRCISRMYRDTSHGAQPIGWVFQQRIAYEDSAERYVRETWVEVAQGETNHA